MMNAGIDAPEAGGGRWLRVDTTVAAPGRAVRAEFSLPPADFVPGQTCLVVEAIDSGSATATPLSSASGDTKVSLPNEPIRGAYRLVLRSGDRDLAEVTVLSGTGADADAGHALERAMEQYVQAIALVERGDITAVGQCALEAARLLESIDERRAAADVLYNSGIALQVRAHIDEARPLLERASGAYHKLFDVVAMRAAAVAIARGADPFSNDRLSDASASPSAAREPIDTTSVHSFPTWLLHRVQWRSHDAAVRERLVGMLRSKRSPDLASCDKEFCDFVNAIHELALNGLENREYNMARRVRKRSDLAREYVRVARALALEDEAAGILAATAEILRFTVELEAFGEKPGQYGGTAFVVDTYPAEEKGIAGARDDLLNLVAEYDPATYVKLVDALRARFSHGGQGAGAVDGLP